MRRCLGGALALLLFCLGSGCRHLQSKIATSDATEHAPVFEEIHKIDVHTHIFEEMPQLSAFYAGADPVQYDGRTVEALSLPRKVLEKFHHENARRIILQPAPARSVP